MEDETLSVEQCQKHAKACRDMAGREANPKTRKSLEDLATTWEKLCAEIRKTARTQAAGPPQTMH